MGGEVLAEASMGGIVDKFSWNGGFIFLMGSCILSIVFLLFTWNVHDRSKYDREITAS